MKKTVLLFLLSVTGVLFVCGQQSTPDTHQQKAITSLIDQYSEAREKSDTILLKSILTSDVDQLVSTGEWRKGISAAVQGMLKSSGNSPGVRTLRVESIRMLGLNSAIVDCRYEIQNTDGTARKCGAHLLLLPKTEFGKSVPSGICCLQVNNRLNCLKSIAYKNNTV